MLIACKYEEMYIPEINDFVYITNNTFSAANIRNMEMKVLNALDFQLGRPLPIHFLRRYSKAANVCAITHNVAKYTLEAGFVHHDFSSIPPSLQAAAALLLAIWIVHLNENTDQEEDVDLQKFWSPDLGFYSGYEISEVKDVAMKFGVLLKTFHSSKHSFPFTKYSGTSKLKVATLVQAHVDALAKLTE